MTPKLGLVVHYVTPDDHTGPAGVSRAAIIANEPADGVTTVDLYVILPQGNRYLHEVPYSEHPANGTWHYGVA